MSNELFIVCLSHDPEIQSDITTVRRWIALRDLFLAQHPHCRLGLIDESGTRHPVTEDGDEPAPEPSASAAVSAEDAEREPVNLGKIAAAAAQIATAIRQASLFALDRPDPLPVVVCENLADAVIDLLRSNPELVTQIMQGAPESAAVSAEDAEREPVDVGEIADDTHQPIAADQWMDQWRIVPTGPVERGGEMRRPKEAK